MDWERHWWQFVTAIVSIIFTFIFCIEYYKPNELQETITLQVELIATQESIIESADQIIEIKDEIILEKSIGMAYCFKACDLVIQKCKEELNK